MNHKIYERIMNEAYYMLKTGYTVREIANHFGVSKSTVHKDLHERLPKIDFILFQEIKKILNFHNCIRHIRGGESTKKKFQNL